MNAKVIFSTADRLQRKRRGLLKKRQQYKKRQQ